MNKAVPYPAHTLITQPDVSVRVTRQPNNHLLVKWQGAIGPVTISAYTTPQAITVPLLVQTVSESQEARFTNLDPTQRIYFQLEFEDGRCLTAAERVLPLQRAVNFRDIGGYETQDGRFTKWGQVYRAGNLHALTPTDQQYLHNLDLKLVCDLRSTAVIRKRPDRFLPDPQRQHQQFAMRNPSRVFSLRAIWAALFRPRQLNQMMLEGYIRLAIEGNTAVICQTLQQLADPHNLPILIHCAAGKDRTGIIIALLLSLLGVPEPTIMADYSLSNAYYDDFIQAIAEDIRPLTRWGISPHALYPLHIAHPQTLRDTFIYIRQKYGSIQNYLQNIVGLDQVITSQIQQNLLE